MRVRVSRVERTEQNRERVLAAARRVFVAQGFHVATLDQIALEAGFSKGVVYSQFESKADMFLALLAQRIEERKQAQLRVADFEDMVEAITRVARAEPAWRLLVIEFRVFAARDRKLNRRYAELHESAIAGIVALLEQLYQRWGMTPPAPLATLARNLLAIENGEALENVVGEPLPLGDVTALLRRVLGVPPRKSGEYTR
jgi:AcrR family transcriptional regulator